MAPVAQRRRCRQIAGRISSVLWLAVLLAWGVNMTGSAKMELSATTVRGGGSFDVTITAPEWDWSTDLVGTLQAMVTCDKVNEPAHEVSLLETDKASGIFVGRVATVQSSSAALPLPGLIHVVPGSLITVAYPSTTLKATIRVLFPGFFVGPTSLAIGDDLLVELKDPDVNIDSKVRDSVAVQVSVSCSQEMPVLECPSEMQDRIAQEVEVISLVETSPDSGIFTAALKTYLQQGSSAPHALAGDKAIDLRGASDKCGADQVTITYSDVAPASIRSTVLTASFRAQILVSHSHVTAAANHTVNITVFDGDLLNRTSIQLVVSSSKEDEPPETLILTSTGSCQGTPTFVGAFSTSGQLGDPLEGDSNLQVRPGDIIFVSYVDDTPYGVIRKQIRVLTDGGIVVGPSRNDKSSLLGSTNIATIELGSHLTVTVTDEDQDLHPYTADTIPGIVLKLADNSAQSQAVLVETGLSTGVFTALHPVMAADSCTSAACQSSSLLATHGSIVHVEYQDVGSDNIKQTRQALAKVASSGTVSMQMPEPGNTLSITVVDSDLDQLSDTIETVSVFVRADTTGDSKIVELSETSASSGTFEGSLSTDNSPDAAKLHVSASTASLGTVIEVAYLDAIPHSSVISRLRMCSSAEVIFSPSYFIPGEASLSITLVDADLQEDPLSMDRVTVSVVSTEETESLDLVETGWSTSTFTGLISTSASSLTAGDGIIQIRSCCSNRDTVHIQYSEGCPFRTLSSSFSKPAVAGSVTASPSLVKVGDAITVTVTDATLNEDDATAESYADLVVVSANGQSISVPVTEANTVAGKKSGIFTGTVATTGTPASGKLLLPDISGVLSSPIKVQFTDVIEALERSIVVLETQRIGSIILSQQGTDSGVIAIGHSVLAIIYDKDLDYGGGSVSVQMTKQQGTPDTVTISLTEDGLGQGRYTGQFKTSAGTGPSNDDTLNSLQTGQTVRATYTDTDGSQSTTDFLAGMPGQITISNDDGGLINQYTSYIDVTLTDSDLNTDATVQETYDYVDQARVVIFQRETLSYAVEMKESSVNSAQFVCRINFDQPGNALPLCTDVINSNCAISKLVPTGKNEQGLRWDRASLEYNEPDIPAGGRVRGEESNRAKVYLAPGQDAELNIASSVVAGSILKITVIDQDMSKSTDIQETCTVDVKNKGDTRTDEMVQTVNLSEDGLQSATFTGILRTYNDLSVNTNVVGGMNVAEGEVLEVTYIDSNRLESSTSATILKEVNVAGWNTCRGGTLAGAMCSGIGDSISCGMGYCGSSKPFLEIGAFKAGSCVPVTLRDPDSNTQENSRQQVTIEVENIFRNDKETFILVETTENSENFVGCIQSVAVRVDGVGIPQDDKLAVNAGDEVSVRFDDTEPVLSISRTILVQASNVGQLSITPEKLRLGNDIQISLDDADLDSRSGHIDLALVFVSAGDASFATNLTETGYSTGLFTGIVSTSNGLPSILAGLSPGDEVTVSYMDEVPYNTTRFASAAVGRVGLLTMSTIRLEGVSTVTLTDDDVSTLTAIEAYLSVVGKDGQVIDRKSVLLQRTLEQTTFVGTYSITADMSAPNADSKEFPILLGVDLAKTISIEYQDDSPEVNVSASISVLSSSLSQLHIPSTIPSGTPLQITVLDQDLNLDSSTIETGQVTISSSDLNQLEVNLLLYETTPSSGAFTGQLRTYQGVAHAKEDDQALDSNSGDILTVTYEESAPSRSVVSNTVVTSSSQGILYLSSYALREGETLIITVDDSDLNSGTQVTDFVNVEVAAGHLSVQVSLKETDVNSARFTGEFKTIGVGLSASNESVLKVTYLDTAPTNKQISQAKLIPSNMGSIDIGLSAGEFWYDNRVGTKIRTVAAGDSIPVTVEDADLNSNHHVRETSLVTVYTSRNDQLVDVVIYETSVNSNVFTGFLITRLVETALDGITDVLDVLYGDRIGAYYEDQAPAARIKTANMVRIATPATIQLTPTYAIAGTLFHVTLFDQDLDKNATLMEEATVNILSPRIKGNMYAIQVIETAESSGIFTASIESQDKATTALAQHGRVNVQAGDVLTAEYTDDSPTYKLATATALVQSRSCGCANISTAFQNIAAGESLLVTVYDPDRNVEKDASDSLEVKIENLDRPNQVHTEMKLQESAPSSSLFTGTLQTRDSKVQPASFVGYSNDINVNTGDDLQIEYLSITPSGTIEKKTLVYIHFLAHLTVTPKPLLAGGTATITVRDDDLDVGDSIDATYAQITSSRAGEPEKNILVTETGARSGVFTGVFEAHVNRAVGILADADKVNVDPGDILTVSYEESVPQVRRIEFQEPIAQVAEIAVRPVPLRADGMLTIEIADVDANLNPYEVEHLFVNVSTDSGVFTRAFMLQENGPNSGIFTYSIPMSSKADESNISLAWIRAKEMLTVSYHDLAPAGKVERTFQVLESAVSALTTAPVLKAGGRLALVLTDPDLNGLEPESIFVTADAYRPVLTPGVAPGTYSREGQCTVKLKKETPYSTSFAGFLETGISFEHPGCLYVVADDKVVISYSELSPLSTISNEVFIESSQSGTIATSTNKVMTKGSFDVTVTDSDLDTNPDQIESIKIEVETSVSALSAMEMILFETSMSSSIFTGSVRVEPWGDCILDSWGCTQYASKDSSEDNILYVQSGQSILIKYFDLAPYQTQQVVVPVCTIASLEVHPLIIAIGWNLTIFVHDPDRAGTGTAEIVASVDGRYWTFTLHEYSPGRFKGSAATDFVSRGHNSTLQVQVDSTILFAFSDDCPGNSVSVRVKALKLGKLELSPNTIQNREVMSIIVEDKQNAKKTDSSTVNVICAGSLGDEQDVILTETSRGSGVYSGSIIPGMTGEISALPDTSISCRYPLKDPPSLLQEIANVQRSFAGSVSASPLIVNTGGVLTISVSDKDLNSDPTITESHSLRLVVKTSQDSKFVDLVETSNDSPVFTGKIVVAEKNQNDIPMDILLGSDKDFVTMTYSDNAPKGSAEAKVRISASNVGVLRIKPEMIRVGSSLQVLVADADLNRDPQTVESATVLVSVVSQGSKNGIVDNAGRRFDMEAVVQVHEMTASTQFFTGKLITVGINDAQEKPNTPDFENVIYVMNGYTVTLRYADEAPLSSRIVNTVVQPSDIGRLSFTPNPPTVGEALTVTVVDADLEYDAARAILPGVTYSAGPSNCEVFGHNEDCRDVGVLPIVPTTEGGSVYTGKLELYDGIAVGPAGPCYLSCYDVSSQEGETIVFSYADEAPTQTLQGQVKIATRAELFVPAIGLEGAVFVTVYDQDLNQDISHPEKGEVLVERDPTGLSGCPDCVRVPPSSVVVNLTETGENTGFFTGLLPTLQDKLLKSAIFPITDYVPPDPVLEYVTIGQNITVRYYDVSPEKMWRSHSSLVIPSHRGVISFTSTGEQIGDTFMKPARLKYSLVDPDLNVDPVREETVKITITSSDLGQSQESVTLVENGFDTGTFTADLRFTVGSFNGIPNNLAMDVAEGDFITAVYDDSYPYKPRPALSHVTHVAKVASIGKLIVNPSPVTAGREIHITVIDADLNTDSQSVDIGSVIIFNNERNDNETVVLTEVSKDSNLFTGVTMSTQTAGELHGTLSGLYEGGAVHAIYKDAIPDYVINDCRQCFVTNKVAMSANVSISPELLPVGGNLTVTVFDTDLNMDTSRKETAEVEVKQFFREPYDMRIVTMTETGPDTNVFTGTVATKESFTPGAYGGRTEALYGPQGARIAVYYRDLDPYPTRVVNATSRISMVGSISIGPDPLNPGTRITITVRDDDLDLTMDVDELTGAPVLVNSPNDVWNSEGISVLLVETGPSTGYFTGTRETQEKQSTSAGVIISGAVEGSYITATYTDPIPYAVHVATSRVATFANLTVNPAILNEGNTIFVTVNDADLSEDPLVVETHRVSVSQISSYPDSMNLTIVETANASNTFTGAVMSNMNGGVGILKVPEGSLVKVEYFDRNPTPARLLTVKRRVSIQGRLFANTATALIQDPMSDGTLRFKPTVLATDGAEMSSCFIIPGDATCSGTCRCRSFPNIVVTVMDEDIESPDIPRLVVYNTKGVEYETVVMTATVITATFSGSIGVTDDAAEGSSDSGSLNVVPGDIIQIAYLDSSPPKNTLTNYRIPSVGRAEFIPKNDAEWTAAAPVIIGEDSLNMKLTDFDLIGDNSAVVTVSCNVGLDSETITLLVTDIPGVFTGNVQTESNYRGVHVQDGKLQVHREDTITLTYVDALPSSTQGMKLGLNLIVFRAELLSHQRVILPDGALYITLVDCDLPELVEPFKESFVQLLTQAGDDLTITLTASDAPCGEYTGRAQTSTRQNFDASKIDAAVPGSEITVTYLDCSDNSPQSYIFNVAKQANLSFASTVESSAAGLPITVYLSDPDQDTSPAADTANVTVQKEGPLIDIELLNLTETGGRTGVFTGVLKTSLENSVEMLNQSNGILNSCSKGDIATATYVHATLHKSVAASMTFLAEAGVVQIHNSTTPFSAEETITVTVRDADLNNDIFEAETYSGILAVNTDIDDEWVTIKETARDSRIFTGIVRTSVSQGSLHDGMLNTKFNASGGSIARFYYNDTDLQSKYPNLCQTFKISHGCNIAYRRSQSVGHLILSQELYAEIGHPIGISVLDGDLNTDFTQTESSLVTISKNTGAQIEVPVTETGKNTGIFTGSILISDTGSSSVSQVTVNKFEKLTFEYNDAVPVGSSRVEIIPRYIGSLKDTFNAILPGGAIRISLTDADLNTNDAVAEMLSGIYVTNLMTHQKEHVTLTETGVTSLNSGTFTGVLKTLADKSRGADFSGAINVQGGDLLKVIYSDSGPVKSVTRDVRVANRAEITKSPLHVSLHNAMTITVTDLDMDRDALAVDTIPNLLDITKGSLRKVVPLTETGLSTGAFTGSITLTDGVMSPSTFGPVSAWESITVTYTDQMPSDKIEKVLPVFAQGQVQVSPWPWIDINTQFITITVSDQDMNRDALVAEIISIDSDQVYVSATVDTNKQNVIDREFLTLTETSTNSGIFTSVLNVAGSGSPVSYDGQLAPITMAAGMGVKNGNIMEATYVDMAPDIRVTKELYPSNVGVVSLSPCLPGENPCKAVLGAGVMLTVTVTDRDLNLDPLAQEQVTVTVRTDRDREPVETITLFECKIQESACLPHTDSNHFVGTIQTVRSSSYSAEADGKINVLAGNCDKSCTGCDTSACHGFVVVEYQDVSPMSSIKMFAKVGHIGKIDLCGQIEGQASLDYCLFDLSKDVITVTLTDPDLDTMKDQPDTYATDIDTPTGMRVRVHAQFSSYADRSLKTSSSLNVAITETGVSTGVFTGTFAPVASSVQSAGSLQIFDDSSQNALRSASSVITATYLDATSEYPKAYARFRTESQIKMSAPDCTAPCPLPIGKPLTITVIDGDMDQDRYKAESLSVKVKSEAVPSPSGLNDQQDVVLVETGLSTGTFVASIKTAVAKSGDVAALTSCDDTVLHAYQEADVVITVKYDELAPLAAKYLQSNSGLTATWPASVKITPSVSFLTNTVTVTVQDFDLVGQDSTLARMTSDFMLGTQYRDIVLDVTGNADTFTGTFLVDSTFVGTPSGTQRRILQATYTDVSHSNVGRSYVAQLAAVGVLTTAPFADSITNLVITLQDSTFDTTDNVETLTPGVVVTTEVGGSNSAGDYRDTETVVLTETGPATSTFTGNLPIVRATTKVDGDGTLQGDLGALSSDNGLTVPTISITYQDALPAQAVILTKKIECEGKVIVSRTFEPMKPFEVTVSDCDLAASDVNKDPPYVETIPITLRTNLGYVRSNITIAPKNPPFNPTKYEALYTGFVTTNTSWQLPGTTNVIGVVSDQNQGSRISVEYQDSAPLGMRSSTTWADVLGELEVNSTFNSKVSRNNKYKLDQKMHLQVTDRDANIRSDEVDSVTVVAKTQTDEEIIALVETGMNSNTFTGWLPADMVGADVQGDNLISPVASHVPITISYEDPSRGKNVTQVVTGADFDSLQLEGPINPFRDELLQVTVVDSDLNTDQSSKQTASNVLQLSRCSPGRLMNCVNSSATPVPDNHYCAQQTMILTEQEQSSSIFVGSLKASTCVNEQDDPTSKFYVVCEGVEICKVTATYTDETWGTFSTTASTKRTGLLAMSYLTGSAGADTFVAGEALHITVTDGDLDFDPSVVDVTTVSLDNSFSSPELLVLTETNVSTGIFTGMARTVAKGAKTKIYIGIETPEARQPLAVRTPFTDISTIDRFQVEPGQNVVVSYNDASPSGHTVTRTIVPRVRATIDSSPFPLLSVNSAGQIVGISNVTVTVVDNDASVTTDTLSVNISVYVNASSVPVDHEMLSLNETSSTSGVFTGTIQTDGLVSPSSNFLLTNYQRELYGYKITYFQHGTGGGDGMSSPTLYRKEARNAKLETTNTLRAGAALSITVTDDDQDLDWNTIDIIYVRVTSDKAHEGSERVQLSETSISSGVFTGHLITTPSNIAGGQDDFLMHVVEGDNLRLAYVEPFDFRGKAALLTKNVSISSGGYRGEVMFVDPVQNYVKAMLINEGSGFLSIMIIDKDPKSTIYGTEITVTTPFQSSKYPINENTTTEVGQDRYVMTIAITTAMGTQDILGGFAMGNVIYLSYKDLLPYETVTTQGVVNKAAILTANPQPIGMGDTLTITVVDEDLNENPQVPNNGTVLVQSTREKEGIESVSITETGISTSVFTGFLRTALRSVAGASNSGNTNVAPADVLTLSYVEHARNSMASDASKLKSITIQVGLPGTLVVSDVVKPSQNIVITVTDADLNLTPENMEHAKVIVSTSKDDETEVVTLTQTGPATGVFTGTLLTCTRCMLGALCPDLCISPPCTCVNPSTCENDQGQPLSMNCPSEIQGPSNDGVLYVEQGNLITTKYIELMPEATHTAFTNVPRLGSMTTVPASYLVPGHDISVIILDNDANADPTRVETIDIDFQTAKAGEPGERLTIYEDDANSGRFVGFLKTIASDPNNPLNTIPGDERMAVDPGDEITVSYQDFKTFSGQDVTLETKITASAAGSLMACPVAEGGGCKHWSYVDNGVVIYMGLPGENFTIVVQDVDLSLNSDIANVSAFVFPSPEGDYEMIELTLVGGSIFSGSLRSGVGNGGTPLDGVLTVTADSEITFTYIDKVPRVTQKAKIRLAARGVLEVGPRLLNGFPALAVNLTDRDLNTKEATREVVTVEIVNHRFPDQITRIGLLESAPSSGFFQGSITLTHAESAESVSDGTLRGLSGDQVTVTYQDSLPAALIKATIPLRFAGGLQTSTRIVAGNEIFTITLSDGDLDTDKTKADKIDGILSLTSDTQDPVSVSLTETALGNGIFTATILPRLSGTDINIDAIDPFGLAMQIQVDRGNHVRLSYVDADNGIPETESIRVFTRGAINVKVTFSDSDGVLQVTVIDADLIGSEDAITAQLYTSDPNQSVETIQLTANGLGSALFTGNVKAQAHTGDIVPGCISLRDTDSIFARYFDQQPDIQILTEISAPRPRFIEPTPLDGARFSTAVDCAVQVGLRGADRSIESQRLVGAAVIIRPTKYRDKDGTYKMGLLPGVYLSDAEPGIFFETSMSWTPRREQEGGVYLMCFVVEESHGLVSTNSSRPERCFEFIVTPCRKCALPGESLNHLSSSVGSEWLAMWSLNPEVKTPSDLLDGLLINTSLTYRVVAGDSMASISMRFGTTVKFLLALNVDLTAEGKLFPNSTICVLPNQGTMDGCPAQARSSTWEKIEEQYVPVDYYDNPFNWEDIQWTDKTGKPVKSKNVDYPQLPARMVGKQPGYSLPKNPVE